MENIVNFMAIHKGLWSGGPRKIVFGHSKSTLRRVLTQMGYDTRDFKLYPITPTNGVFLWTGVKDGQGTDSN